MKVEGAVTSYSLVCHIAASRNQMQHLLTSGHNIFSLWLQGADNAPRTVRLCLDRWRNLNPGYRLHVLERNDVEAELSGFPLTSDELTVQALSDILRARLLSRYGGVWADATTFPTMPLDDWLQPRLSQSGFFAFDNPGPDRVLSSWFLAAKPESYIMNAWWGECLRYWGKRRSLQVESDGKRTIPENPTWEVAPDGGAGKDTYPYFWFHYLFALLVERNATFRDCWQCSSTLPADPAHVFQQFRRSSPGRVGKFIAKTPLLDRFLPANRRFARLVLESKNLSPVQKLTWRGYWPTSVLKKI